MKGLILPFEMEPQQGSLLCWAAIAVSLKRFYDPRQAIDQIGFARSLLGENYDQVCAPLDALEHAGLRYREQEGCIAPGAIQRELEQGHPVLVAARFFIGWHLLVVHGIDGDQQLMIADPLHGASRCSYVDFASAYREHYAWSHTYCRIPA
ncbi:papain-like cysteine protease family protein [Janthinobacterium sp.]|uniref:papain-like cysteine protease family protein n=1 Tax=Janthinobacterium sp. TaxID=1871054 RepID=UPI0026057336|nr:papain-like cysteine protease family protein [Janthinobacterium sp.]